MNKWMNKSLNEWKTFKHWIRDVFGHVDLLDGLNDYEKDEENTSPLI